MPNNAHSDQHLRAMAARLRDCLLNGQREDYGPGGLISTQNYLSEGIWKAEQAQLFRKFPLIAAREEELQTPGNCISVNLAGRSVLLTRDDKQRVHAFLNACRHRGMSLLDEAQAVTKKRISCPYHGWTYGLDGELKGIPHEDAFTNLQRKNLGLRALPCEVRHGFVWVQLDHSKPMPNIGNWLGTLDDDFNYFDLDNHVLYRESTSQVQANWKLCIDAFLEAYHVRVLHRNTVGPFFEDAFAVSDTDQPHFRSGVARKGLRLSGISEADQAGLREAISFTHFVFPNQVFVFHPDYVSQMSILPTSARQFTWRHRMLIPASDNTAELKEHWDNSFELIENGVFQSEDLRAAERIQVGLETQANDYVQAGQLETLLVKFHQHIDHCIETHDKT